jgi:DNA polymerase III epsilon subunit-like protein
MSVITVFDSETTGLNVLKDNPLQVCVLQLDEKTLDTVSCELLSFWQKGWYIDPGAEKVHGLSREKMEPFADKFELNTRKLYRYLSESTGVSYNGATYDLPLLRYFLGRQSLGTIQLRRHYDMYNVWTKAAGRAKLGPMVQKAGLDESHVANYANRIMPGRDASYHDAVYDVAATALLFGMARSRGLVV